MKKIYGGSACALADKQGETLQMDETMKSKMDWLRCPRCGGKTRIQIRPRTVRIQIRPRTILEDFPLFCPKCKYTCVIRFKDGKIEKIKMPDA